MKISTIGADGQVKGTTVITQVSDHAMAVVETGTHAERSIFDSDGPPPGRSMRTRTAANGKQVRGFAAMAPEKLREICARGGRASHAKGTGHEWSSDAARKAGAKGGRASRGGRGKAPVVGPREAAVAPLDTGPHSAAYQAAGEMTPKEIAWNRGDKMPPDDDGSDAAVYGGPPPLTRQTMGDFGGPGDPRGNPVAQPADRGTGRFAKFIQDVPLGTEVRYHMVMRDGKPRVFPGVPALDTRVCSAPFQTGSGDILVSVDGKSGGVLITHLELLAPAPPPVHNHGNQTEVHLDTCAACRAEHVPLSERHQ